MFAGVMDQASGYMVAGDYDAALGLYGTVLAEDPDHDEARRGVAEAEKGKRLAGMSEEEMLAHISAMQLHMDLGMEAAEAPGSSKVRAAQLGRGAGGAMGLPTPTQPMAHREGHGAHFLRVCIRLPPDATADAGEQAFDVQYGGRFMPGWETVTVQGVPEGDVEGYIWLLLVDNLASNTSFVIRCRTNGGDGLVGHWSFKSKPMLTTKTS